MSGRAFKQQVVLIGAWLIMVVVVVFLWRDSSGGGPVIGFAQSVEYKVSPLRVGRIQDVAVELGQLVEQGQLVVTLDPRDLDAEIKIKKAERERIAATLAASESKERGAAFDTTRNLAEAGEATRLSLAKAQAEHQVKSAELKAMSAQLKEMRALLAKGMVVKRDIADLEVRYATLQNEVTSTRASIRLLQSQSASANARRVTRPMYNVELAVAPLQAQLQVIERQLQQLETQRGESFLRAPITGRVSMIHMRTGEVAQAGVPVVSIVSGNSDRIMACVSEQQAMQVSMGDKAIVFPREGRGEAMHGHVMSLGPIVDEVPPRCRPNPQQPAWGRNVVIRLDEAARLVPGQAFVIELKRAPEGGQGALAAEPEQAGGGAGKAAAPTSVGAAEAADQPALMQVPPLLNQRSRIEPSGIVWAPKLGRYVVVSDDTGYKTANNHAPWLFTMDHQGQLGAEPLVIKGLDAINDLEAVAPAPDGGLYVLASQSYSKKGKRKPSRTIFARLTPEAGSYRLDRRVSLADLLDAAGAKTRAALGITDTRALDIEGLTADGAGLLLGLKAPLDSHDRALVWRLAAPEKLFAEGTLDNAGLTLYGALTLSVKADGKQVPGGIAEILKVDEGTFLVASTASGTNPSHQSGSLWRVTQLAGSQPQAALLRVFDGLKPEGLALSPREGRVMVVFDVGASTPLWMEYQWPR